MYIVKKKWLRGTKVRYEFHAGVVLCARTRAHLDGHSVVSSQTQRLASLTVVRSSPLAACAASDDAYNCLPATGD